MLPLMRHPGGWAINTQISFSWVYRHVIGVLIACTLNFQTTLAQSAISGTEVNQTPLLVPGQLSTFRLDVDGVTREALVYVPEGISNASDRLEPDAPVLLAFHGYGSRAESFARWVDFKPLADREGFVLIYPQGLPIDGAAESFHWNPLPTAKGNKSNSDDLGFIDALLDALDAPLKLDPGRTFAMGYSNGGMFAYALACFRSARFAAVGIHAGTILEATAETCEPSERTSIAVFHGTADPVVRISGSSGRFSLDQIIDHWTQLQGLVEQPFDGTLEGRVATRIFNPADAGQGGMVVHKVWGGGHVWQQFEIDSQNADDWLWSFFWRNGH